MQPKFKLYDFLNSNLSQDASIIFGGTFDPIHEGHVEDIRRLSKNTKRVFIAPTMQNPWKSINPSNLALRIEMIELVLKYEKINYGFLDDFGATQVVLIKEAYTYSIDIVKKIRDLEVKNLYWGIGEDLESSCQNWKDWDLLGIPFVILPLVPNYSATSVRNKTLNEHPALTEFIRKNQLYLS